MGSSGLSCLHLGLLLFYVQCRDLKGDLGVDFKQVPLAFHGMIKIQERNEVGKN